jgi:hypothetical protein
MYPDFKELLSVLNAHRVKYLVVGAYAVSVHAQPRATKDLDILIKADADNAKAVYAALAQFGAPLEGLTTADFAERARFFIWAGSHWPSTFSRRFPVLSLMQRGSVALKTLSTRRAA